MFRRSPTEPARVSGDPLRRTDSALGRNRVRVRRAVLAKRRPLAAGAAALAVFTSVSAARPPAPETEPVLVAARDLPAGTALAPDDLRVVDRELGTVPTGAVRGSPSALAGETLTGPMRAGEALTDWRLVESLSAGAVPAGQVLTSVRLADPAALVLLEPGLRIDLVAADPAGEGTASVVASDALVVAVPDSEDAAAEVAGGPVVVLAVPEGTAVRLADAAVRSSLSPMVAP
jgi:Flp pilus assembly protein CpaB